MSRRTELSRGTAPDEDSPAVAEANAMLDALEAFLRDHLRQGEALAAAKDALPQWAERRAGLLRPFVPQPKPEPEPAATAAPEPAVASAADIDRAIGFANLLEWLRTQERLSRSGPSKAAAASHAAFVAAELSRLRAGAAAPAAASEAA